MLGFAYFLMQYISVILFLLGVMNFGDNVLIGFVYVWEVGS